MCLTIKESLKSAIKVAKEDMTFYKAVSYDDGIITPFQYFQIEVGKEYTINGKIEDVNCVKGKIDEGVFHLYKNYDDALNSEYPIILKTILKKGEKYIEGKFYDTDSVGVKKVNYSFATDSDKNLYNAVLLRGIDYMYTFSEGFARVKLNDKWNFIDKEGDILLENLLEKWFDNAGLFSEGFALVHLNGKWNFIDKKGRYISEQWFDWGELFFRRIRLT